MRLSSPKTDARASDSRMRPPNFHSPFPIAPQDGIKSSSAMLLWTEKAPFPERHHGKQAVHHPDLFARRQRQGPP
eukprot:1295951-Pyramimonas_sp.AAC.1